MHQDPNLFITLNFILGACVGAYGTVVGAGGGFLLVPVFLLLLGLPHEIAVGTSLVIVAANAFSGTVGYVRDRRIDYRAGWVFAFCTFPGALVGSWFTVWLSGPAFQRIFGILLLVTATYLMLRKPISMHPVVSGKRGWGWRERRVVARDGTSEHYEYYEPLGAFVSVFVGMISSWFGIGGGIVHVPLMTEVLHFPVHVAVPTSHFILGLTAFVGALVHFSQGHVNLPIALAAGAGAAFGAQGGVFLSRRIKAPWVLRALSLALFAVSLRLIFT